MKLVGLLMTALFSQSCDTTESRTLTFKGKDLSLQEVFRVIKTQSGVCFFYDASLLDNAKPVTVNWKNANLETALNDIFKDQAVNWVMNDKTVTIIRRRAPYKAPEN